MPARQLDDAAQDSRLAQRVRHWNVVAAAGLGLAGCMLMFASAEDGPLWQRSDAIFGIRTRMVLVIGSLAHLLLAGYLGFSRNLLNRAFLSLWLVLNYSVYRLGLAWLDAKGLPPVLQCVGDVLRIKPQSLNTGWTCFTVYLGIGGVLGLFVEWRRWKRIKADSFMERWKKLRQQPVGKS